MFVELTAEQIEELSEAYPSRLIVILYDEAINSLLAAMDAIARGDITARCIATTRAAEVISELYISLDMELGGEIAENLAGIYSFVLAQLPQINFTNDIMMVEQLVKLLRPIRDSWAELDDRIHYNVEGAEAMESLDVAATVVANEALAAGGAR